MPPTIYNAPPFSSLLSLITNYSSRINKAIICPSTKPSIIALQKHPSYSNKPRHHIHSNMSLPTPQPLLYLSSPVLAFLQDKIQNPPDGKHPEHHVGAWLCTLIKNIFNGDPWALTLERIDENSNKRPDLVVGKLDGDQMLLHLFCEVKKVEGDRFEKALDQVIKDIAATMDRQGSTSDDVYETFVVIQRGMDIALFEYHNYETILNGDGIYNFKGCVSLTQNSYGPAVIPAASVQNLKPLFYDAERLRGWVIHTIKVSGVERKGIKLLASLI